jgi:hypothetical protein
MWVSISSLTDESPRNQKTCKQREKRETRLQRGDDPRHNRWPQEAQLSVRHYLGWPVVGLYLNGRGAECFDVSPYLMVSGRAENGDRGRSVWKWNSKKEKELREESVKKGGLARAENCQAASGAD